MTSSQLLSQTFQYEKLTPLPTNRRPNRMDILTLHNEGSTNASSIPSTRGNQWGHLHIMCRTDTQDWNARTGNAVAFVPPPNPGEHPTIPPTATAREERDMIRVHTADKASWHTYTSAESILQKQLIAASGEHYLLPLKHATTGLTNVTPSQILTHLYDNYLTVTDEMPNTNMEPAT